MRINHINGVDISFFSFGSLYCDYCNVSIKDKEYYYCWDCVKDMCILCFEETDEEKAIANGAKNFKKRQDSLKECRQHLLKKRDYPVTTFCDVCNDVIIDNQLYSLDIVNSDLCLKCEKTDKGQEIIKDKSLKLVKNKIPMDSCEFGSMLDWIPVIKNKDQDMILLNMNPDSKYYEKVCLMAIDNHGRQGYSIVTNDNFEKICEYIEIIQKETKWDDLDGWDKFYSTSIKQYMNGKNMSIHFG
jgi:hypothetical protein